MTNIEMRVVRDRLRHELFHALNEIEEIVGRALDHIAEEAVTYGADEAHGFAIDYVAAQAADRIGRELDGVVAKALQTMIVIEIP